MAPSRRSARRVRVGEKGQRGGPARRASEEGREHAERRCVLLQATACAEGWATCATGVGGGRGRPRRLRREGSALAVVLGEGLNAVPRESPQGLVVGSTEDGGPVNFSV
jgi:hypothetical protein